MQNYGRNETVAPNPELVVGEFGSQHSMNSFSCCLLLQAIGFFWAVSSHHSADFQAFQSGTSSRHEPQTTLHHTTALSSEPNPNINLWNHKDITKLCSIFLIKRKKKEGQMKGRREGESKGAEGRQWTHTEEWFELKSNLHYFLALWSQGFRMFSEPYLNWMCISQPCPSLFEPWFFDFPWSCFQDYPVLQYWTLIVDLCGIVPPELVFFIEIPQLLHKLLIRLFSCWSWSCL